MLQLKYKDADKGPLWLVENKYTVGANGACDIQLSADVLSDQHAEFVVHNDRVELFVPISAGEQVRVNGNTIGDQSTLVPGDVVTFGSERFELFDPKSMKNMAREPSIQRAWSLKALNTALAEKDFPISGSQVIGRSQECDISLAVVHLSRKHARVTVTDCGLHVEDLESANGTFINNKKVTEGIALDGDEIGFDTLRFRVKGPLIDSDRTALRPAEDGEMTTIRPAIDVAAHPAAADTPAR